MNTLIRILVLAAMVSPLFAQAPDSARLFEEGNRLYAEKNFEGAQKAYTQIVESGVKDPGVFLNLAHAEYKLARPVRAAVNYRRALALDPANAAARGSLEHVQRELGQPIPGVGFSDLAGQYIPFDVLSVLGSLLFWVGLLLVLFAAFARPRRTGLVVLGAAIAVLGATASAISWAGDSRITMANTSIVTADTVARGAPAENGQNLVDLKKGAAVRVLAARDDWSLVQLPTPPGFDGWVPSANLEPVFPRTAH